MVESVKAVSDLYAPISGEVVEVNEALRDTPELLNTAPFEDGWIARVKLSDPAELDALLDAAAYAELTGRLMALLARIPRPTIGGCSMRWGWPRSKTCSPTSRRRFAPERFDLPAPLTEQEVRAELTRLAGRNRIPRGQLPGRRRLPALVPSVVMEVIGRSEFATSYTPYQPEVSQGTLQSIYEFQSLICELTGMEVASASHYDGATATAEAALMACRLTRRDRIAISTAVAPQVRAVLATYCSGPGIEIVEVPADLVAGGSGLTPVEAPSRCWTRAWPAWWRSSPTSSAA